MRMVPSGSARLASGVALLTTLAMVVLAFSASAYPLRPTQIAFQNASLQRLFNGLDGGVNTAIAQLDAQTFSSNSTRLADWTLVIKLGSTTGLNTMGVYNTSSAGPTLCELFPDSALADCGAHCKFFGPCPNAGKLLVTLFDASGFVVGTTSFAGVTRDAFGFYI